MITKRCAICQYFPTNQPTPRHEQRPTSPSWAERPSLHRHSSSSIFVSDTKCVMSATLNGINIQEGCEKLPIFRHRNVNETSRIRIDNKDFIFSLTTNNHLYDREYKKLFNSSLIFGEPRLSTISNAYAFGFDLPSPSNNSTSST